VEGSDDGAGICESRKSLTLSHKPWTLNGHKTLSDHKSLMLSGRKTCRRYHAQRGLPGQGGQGPSEWRTTHLCRRCHRQPTCQQAPARQWQNACVSIHILLYKLFTKLRACSKGREGKKTATMTMTKHLF
jgi:hypothetical protein